MGGDDFRKDDDFRKGGGLSKEELRFERLMENSNPMDAAVVREVSKRFFRKLSEYSKTLSVDDSLTFTIDAEIGDSIQMNLFESAIASVLKERGLTGNCSIEHDGDFVNTHASSTDHRLDNPRPTTQLRFLFGRSELPDCPCCGDSRDVDRSGLFHYVCNDASVYGIIEDEYCNLPFRITLHTNSNNANTEYPFEYPNCEICKDSENVDWGPYQEGGRCCGAEGSEHGCGPFYCWDCGHYIDTGGNCVDPECDCENWEDQDDDDDDDDDYCDDCGEEWDDCECD